MSSVGAEAAAGRPDERRTAGERLTRLTEGSSPNMKAVSQFNAQCPRPPRALILMAFQCRHQYGAASLAQAKMACRLHRNAG